ncbi:TetR/AcrR family transcriptional regulator [Neisseria sp.]|uniref:TetR/AcrR family transcriptional regulator n=1 Tax=Neisseria sp. TaxID=192066 RepID=UPI0035A1B41C
MVGNSIRSRFLMVGLQLYPGHGYRGLSINAIADRAGHSQEEFIEIFGSKKAYMADLLAFHFEESFGRVNFDVRVAESDIESLRCILWRIALCLRNDSAWINRLLADTQDGVKVVGRYFVSLYGRLSDGLILLLQRCDRRNNYTSEEAYNRFDYLYGAVFSPMILSMRLDDLGVLPKRLSKHLPDMMSDHVVKQRIDWTLSVLFPDAVLQNEALPCG